MIEVLLLFGWGVSGISKWRTNIPFYPSIRHHDKDENHQPTENSEAFVTTKVHRTIDAFDEHPQRDE
jgi:hypothetical protein